MQDVLEALTGYPALIATCFFCGLGLPFPEDVPQVWAGIQIATGQMEWLPAIAAASVGVFLRDMVFFGTGRLLGGRALTHPWALRLVGEERLQTAKARVQARGPVAVLIGRFTIGFRVATFFVAGAMGVRPRDFVLWDGLALLASVPLLIGLGYLFGEPVVAAVMSVKDYAGWAVPLVVVAAGLTWWLRARTRQSAVAPAPEARPSE